MEITCVPREHLKFENSGESFTHTTAIPTVDLNFIRTKMKNVKVELERLLYNFHAVCNDAKFDSDKELFKEGNELAHDVERALEASDGI